MAFKLILLFVSLVLIIGLESPVVEAQLPPIAGVIRIGGTIFCTVNASISVNGSTTPVFPSKISSLHR